MSNHKSETLLAALEHLFRILEHHCQICPEKIECDNEIFIKRKAVIMWLQSRFVKVEPSPPYVKELDGAAERSGGVVKDKARSMRQAAKLPAALLAATIRGPENSEPIEAFPLEACSPRQEIWKAAFKC